MKDQIQKEYKIYTIERNNKKRQIEEPSKELKKIQRDLVKYFETFNFHQNCHSLLNKSISTNAEIHQYAKHLLRIDIYKCYQHTTRKKIVKGYSLVKNEIDKEFLQNLEYCLWYNHRSKQWILPTGAPTSPILCNIALTPIDYEVSNYVSMYGYKYSRYIDDMHISTDCSRRRWALKKEIEDIITQSYNYHINYKKSRWITIGSDKSIITGVKIGTNNRVPRDFYRMIRAKLNNLAKNNLQIDQEARGCLSYINSIDKNRYNNLLQYYQKRCQK